MKIGRHLTLLMTAWVVAAGLTGWILWGQSQSVSHHKEKLAAIRLTQETCSERIERDLSRLTLLAADPAAPKRETLFSLSRVHDNLLFLRSQEACDPIILAEIQSGLDFLSILIQKPQSPTFQQSALNGALDKISSAWEQILASLDYRILRSSRQLSQSQQALSSRLIGAALAWLGLMFAAWRWCLSTVIRPIQRLAAHAHKAKTHGIPFSMTPSGPKEIRQLARVLEDLSNEMEELVRVRMGKLESKRHWLIARNAELAELVSQQQDRPQQATVLLHNTTKKALVPLTQLLVELRALEQTTGLDPVEEKSRLQRIRQSAETLAKLLDEARAA